MISFSYFEVLIVATLSVSIFAWQTHIWQISERIDGNETNAKVACSLQAQSTHRREDEKYWFLEHGELICGQ